MKKPLSSKNDVAAYYTRLGSWLGYNVVMGRSQHAGYWTKETKNEKEAQRNYLDELSKLLLLKPGEKVLDAGSGQGYAARYLAKATGADITGITITPREVRVSEKLSRGSDNLHFVLGDYAKTDFSDESFDVVYTTETLSHAKDMKKTMKEFYRILRPGGRLILVDYEVAIAHMAPEEKLTTKFLYDYAGGYGLYQQNPGEISEALKEAGFVDRSETDWSQQTKPSYDRLRRLARPFSWITPNSWLAPYFVNTVMASHWYSNLYESGCFRYIVYRAIKKAAPDDK